MKQIVLETGAVREEKGEVRFDLVSAHALERLAKTYSEGSKKYGDHNWRKGLPFSNILNHVEAHIAKFKQGDRTEDHIAHAAWGLFAIMEFQEVGREKELNDLYFIDNQAPKGS